MVGARKGRNIERDGDGTGGGEREEEKKGKRIQGRLERGRPSEKGKDGCKGREGMRADMKEKRMGDVGMKG